LGNCQVKDAELTFPLVKIDETAPELLPEIWLSEIPNHLTSK
jgi:hypothetical protein